MKTSFLAITFLLLGNVLLAQVKYNTDKNGVLIQGYDPVSYFSGKPMKGNPGISARHHGVTVYFNNEANRNKFLANPDKYFPSYGGWCAYAMGLDGSLVEINPMTYEIRDGHLYLFYNRLLTNTLDSWKEEGPEKLKKQADINWRKLGNK